MVVPPQQVLLQRAVLLLQAPQQLQAQQAVPLLKAPLQAPQRGAAQRPLGLVVWRGERQVWGGARTWRAASHPGRG